MKIKQFTKSNIYEQLFSKDVNNREINIYLYNDVFITGYNLYYPNCLLKTSDKLILPVIEKTMSLKMSTIYEKDDMNFDVINNNILNNNILKPVEGNFFFFIYNTDNYFHYLYDTLPYLISYFKIKSYTPDLKLLMQYPNNQKKEFYPFVIEMLNILGIYNSDIEMINDNCLYENVFVSTSYTHDFDSNLPPRNEIYQFYQDIVKIVSKDYYEETPKKIYISRRTWIHNNTLNIGTNYTMKRKMINETKVVEQLLLDDYVEVFTENLSTVDKIMCFANATHVIGAIGGGIANVLFSKPDTRLTAIITPDFLNINSRFRYCLDCVDVRYDYNTRHYETDEFKLYMRVKVKNQNIIGEIIKKCDDLLTLQITDGSNTGWNSINKYQEMIISCSDVEKLDNGLNSSYIYDINKIMFCCHRINTVEELKQIPIQYGVEIDLRDNNGNIYLAHDPYVQGELLINFLQSYNHSFIIFNIKSEGIEQDIIRLIKQFKINDYFFLDSSFPMINKYHKDANFAIRFSEYESIESVMLMKNKVKWVWVDCFTKNPLTKEIYDILKPHFKLCFVSPELQAQDEKLEKYKKDFYNNNIHFDMICTKIYNIPRWNKKDVQIIIPMSGVGQRFINAGYKDPKPLIMVDDKPIIEHVVNLFPDENDVIFICNNEHLLNTDMYNILNIISENCEIYGVPNEGRQGPVHAVSLMFEFIDDEKEVIVSYCDYGTHWDYEKFLKDVRSNDADGAIACYKGFHPHMLGKDNYAFLKETEENSMWMDEIKEKEPFTNNRMNEYASNGTYYFKSGKLMKKYFQQLIDENLKVNNEFYVSLVYNLLRNDNLKVRIFEIDNMLQWGTPHDLEDYKFWSNYFDNLMNEQIDYDDSIDTTLILPMAGHGSRFSKNGYKDPKPLIKVNNKTMIEEAVNCLPKTSHKTFICLEDHVKEYNIDDILKNKYNDCRVISLNKVTEGQACTCELGLTNFDLEKPILISACDNGVYYDRKKYNDLINDNNVDVIVWTYKNQSASRNNPNMYAWLETDSQDNILNISCKVFDSEKHDIKTSHVIIGTMFFRKAKYFIDGLKKNYEQKITTNNEYYVDDVINQNIKMNLNVKAFCVENYICWGTPDDYETYVYWQQFFNKCSWHKYKNV